MAGPPATKQGTPNWADCATLDLDAAESFYAAVFDWTSERVTASDGAIYSLQHLGGKRVAGIYELSPQLREMGAPPHWGTWIEVDDVDATLELVRSEGGTVVEGPVEETGVGRFAIVQDPTGAFVRIWHSAEGHGAELVNVQGAMIWNELATRDPERAATFYERVLGLSAEHMTEPTPYTTLSVEGRPVAGILEITTEMGDLPASWDVYFGSDDVDRTQEKAAAAGATILRGAFDVPGARIAVIQDPQGAVFELMQMTEPEEQT